MISHELRTVLQNIIQGAGGEEPGDRCSKIRSSLIKSFGASRTSKKDFESKRLLKEKQDKFLRQFAQENECWLATLPPHISYLARGGESKVYLTADGLHVVKINNARYYATWTEYLTSLVLHNLLFPSTGYKLLGFTDDDSVPDGEAPLSVVLQQPFIEGEQANLTDIRELLNYNEFQLLKEQDYFNTEFRIVLEDMHDENVIASQGLLFFIDTVFYVMEEASS